jgi:PAS domain S-box-containing protein
MSPTRNLPNFHLNLLDALTHAVIAVDRTGCILHWNTAASALFGLSAADVEGRKFEELVLEANASRAVVQRLLKLQSNAGEVLVHSADGAELRLLVQAAAIRNDAGDAIGVVLQAEQVEERQRGEAEQRLLAEVGAVMTNSIESENVLERVSRLLVPGVADMCTFYTVTEDGAVRLSAAAYSRDDLEVTMRELESERADLYAPPTIAEVLRDGQSRLLTVDDARIQASARNVRELQLIAATEISAIISVALRARGRTIGAMALCRRAGERFDQRDVRLAEEIARRAAVQVDNQALYERAVVANKSKSDFLAVISHELRTPLTTIMGYVELMVTGVPEKLPPKSAEFLERVRTAAWHLLGLIEQILVYARLEAGRETLMPEPVIVSQLLNDVRALMEPNAIEKGLTFVVDNNEPPLTLTTDLTKVRQILLNLATNAIKFTDSGEIRIGARSDGSDIVIYVSDTGIGIAAEHAERVFDAFWQVDQSATRRVGGAGLGLSGSRRLSRLLGGEMNFSSVVGEGTEFEVRLPRSWRPAEEAVP